MPAGWLKGEMQRASGMGHGAWGKTHGVTSAKLFLHLGTVEGLLKKMNIERPTSNVEWEKMKKMIF
jgi:hypothetical protein